MADANDDAIVAGLMLLLDGKSIDDARHLVLRAMKPRSSWTKWVCTECGSDDITWRCDSYWSNELQDFVTTNWDNTYCGSCTCEASDEQQHVDWEPAKENEETPGI